MADSSAQRAQQGVADLRESLYEFQHLVAEYWSVDHDAVARRAMEQRMTTEQSVIQSRFYRLAGRTRRLNRAYQSTSSARLKLFDAATGGAFQQVSGWEPDQSRIVAARQAIEEITKALP